MKKNLLLLCLLAFCSLTLFGQAGKFPKVVHTTEKSVIHLPPQESPTGLKIIYSNFGRATDLYNATEGWELSGPNFGNTEFIGMPFTPQSDSHVSEFRVAAQYISGANQVNLSLYSDASGTPGTLLAGPVTVTDLPEYGTCCAVAVADFPPVAVIAGTQYWVVADTPLTGTGSDFSGAWNWIVKAAPEWAEDVDDFGWSTVPSDSLPAGGVLGTIP